MQNLKILNYGFAVICRFEGFYLDKFKFKSILLDMKKEFDFLDIASTQNNDRQKLFCFFEHNGFVFSTKVPMFIYRPKNIYSETDELKGYILLHLNKTVADADKYIFNEKSSISNNFKEISFFIYSFISTLRGYEYYILDKNKTYDLICPFADEERVNELLREEELKNSTPELAYLNILNKLNCNIKSIFGRNING